MARNKRKSLEKTRMGIIGYILLAIVLIFVLFPIFWLISTSIKTKGEWVSNPPTFLPKNPTFASYFILFYQSPELLKELGVGTAYVAFEPIVKSLIDSSIVAGISTLVAVLVGMLSAFAVSRHGIGGNTFMLLVLMLRMAPPIVAVIPMIVYFAFLKFTDTYHGLILVYTTFSMPYAVWIIKGLIDEVPRELEESARLDGLSALAAHFKVTLPLIKGGVLATALLLLIFNWSEFLFALMLSRGSIVTVPIQIANYQTFIGQLYGPQAAFGLLAVIPLLVFGIIIRRFLARGLTFGAIKG